ncbi:MAG TPA: DUF5916 domain-containing protein [Bacteroidales bacterium]|nr:hypothetical protein [Bacteroidales bacterium]HNR41854.1 DUF5916 domain-containing protein [Bacteroidales bacterium]HPM18190.1 DUF5916 domain-containing protein [Bacteroidales bacterium]HQG78337.1 DUF5916 domain-containing protein [Bacteroidales bacterium]
MTKPIILLAVSLLIITTKIFPGEAVNIKRIKGEILFDGIPDEPEWANLTYLPMTMHSPVFGAEPSEASEVRIGYDDHFLWIGASLYMNDPGKIFAVTRKRDDRLFGHDAFGIILDTYNDKENALVFYTSPNGIRTDFTISNDAVMNGGGFGLNSSFNISWDTFWDVKTRIDNKGWHVEMKIPFSSLKFKPSGDVTTMGLIVCRNISANNETDTYPAIDPKYGMIASNKPSLAQEIIIEGVKPSKPVYISPYLLGGGTREYNLNELQTGYVRNEKPEYNAGLDIKYNINSNLTLDLTANTDFAQVEADDQQVNLTRYSLFFPEKRKFFQERSSLFDFSLGGFSDNMFYSRSIGVFNGSPVRIYGGARITGRMGRWDTGFLNMQTGAHDSVPGENFGVLRMRRQVINQNSYVGGIITSRLGMNGYKNFGYGIDGIFRLFGVDYLNVKWAQTYDSNLENKMNSLDPSFILVDWERRNEKGFAYRFNYTYSGEQLKPGVGFVMRGAVQGLNGRLSYGWFPGEKSRIYNYSVSVMAEQYNRLDDGNLESAMITPGINIGTKKGINAGLSAEVRKEGVRNDFYLSENVVVKANEYTFTNGQMMFSTPNSKMISVMTGINAGQFYDGLRYGTMTMVNFNISSGFNLSVNYDFNAIRFPDRASNNSLNIHLVNAKALVMFSTKLTAAVMVQYVNSYDNLLTNFRLRYNPREGNDLYLVLNDNRRISGSGSVPEYPRFFNQTVMIKYIHTFIL